MTYRELEALLHKQGQLANATALLAQHVLGAGGTDDDLSAHRGHADLDASVAINAQLTLQQLVELGVKDAIGDELDKLKNSNLIERHRPRIPQFWAQKNTHLALLADVLASHCC